MSINRNQRLIIIDGILGAIVGYILALLVFWLFSFSVSIVDFFVYYALSFIMVPIILGISSGINSLYLVGTSNKLTFLVAFTSTLLALPGGFFVTEIVGANEIYGLDNMPGRTIVYNAIVIAAGLIVEFVLIGVFWLFKKVSSISRP